jgi:branched-chain amino acid transport system ATP-binding protein
LLGVARSFQIPQLCADLTVLDNMLVAMACQAQRLSFWQVARRDEAVDRADALLDRFHLGEHRERRVAELPGGVRKLLDIAMALTGKPKLLLLDEPTSGVSAEEKFPMMDVIMAALAAERTAVLFVEHDMDIVERHAERVIAFYSGRIIADDTPAAALVNDDVRRYVTGSLRQEAAHAGR